MLCGVSLRQRMQRMALKIQFKHGLPIAAPVKHTSLSTGAEGLISNNPLKRLALAVLFVCSYLRMHKHSDCADQPMLPLVRDDNGDALHLLLVALYESSMVLKSRDILPTCEFGSVNQQSNLPLLADE